MELNELKQELSKKGLRRFAYIKVDFGVPLALVGNENDVNNELILQSKGINKYNCNFKCTDLKQLKGVNYGKHELAFIHPAILITNIPRNKLAPNTVMIVPMVSVTDNSKRYKSSFHDFEISKEYDSNLANPFLDNSSLLRVGEIQTIGIERINIKETLQKKSTFSFLWHKDSDKLMKAIVDNITLGKDLSNI